MALTVYCSKYILLNIAAVVNFRVEWWEYSSIGIVTLTKAIQTVYQNIASEGVVDHLQTV
jgi:hypothetical protein